MNLLERLRQEGSALSNEAADALEQRAEERVYDKAQIEQLSNRVTVLRDYVDRLERKLGMGK